MWYERKPENPVLLFGLRTAITTFLHGAVVNNLNTFLSLSYQAILLQTPFKSAITWLPLNTVSLVLIFIYPIAVERFRKYLPSIWMAWVSLALGTGLLHLVDQTSSAAFRTDIPTILTAGYEGLFTVITIPMQASVSNADDTDLAVGLLLFIRLFAGLVGLALGSSIFSNAFGNFIKELGPLPASLAVLENNNQAIGFIPQLRELPATLSPVDLSNTILVYGKSFHIIWLVLAGFAGLGLSSSFFTMELSI